MVAAAKPLADVSLIRLYLLRALYLLIGVGEGMQVWPAIAHHAHWEFWHGVGMSFLGALTLLALLGVRYPVRMLPLLFYEFAWKLIWTLSVWLPLVFGHHVDPDVAKNVPAMLMGVVLVPLVMPWGYVWKSYVLSPADRWMERRPSREPQPRAVRPGRT